MFDFAKITCNYFVETIFIGAYRCRCRLFRFRRWHQRRSRQVWKQLFKQLTINHWFYVPTHVEVTMQGARDANWKISRACTLSPLSPSNCDSMSNTLSINWSRLDSVEFHFMVKISTVCLLQLHFSYHSAALHGDTVTHRFPSNVIDFFQEN